MRTTAALLLAAVAAWGQEAPGQDSQRALQERGIEFWVNLLKNRLNLTEEQTAKVREVIAKDSEERAKADEARNAKIAELLDEDQKRRFEEMRRNPFGNVSRMLQGFGRGGGQGGQPGGQPGGGFGAMAGRFGQVQVEDLKRELGLTDEQTEKIRPIVDEFNEKGRKRFEELREGGFRNFNWGEELQRVQDLVKEAGEKLKPHLTAEQKEKYDQLVESRMQWVRMAQGFLGARGGTPTPGGPPPRLDPEERARRVVEALKIDNESELKAISDLVRQIAGLQAALEEQARAVRDKLQSVARNAELSDEAIEDALREIRRDRRQKERELAELQKQLSESVSNRQEVELILHGILK